MGAARGWRRARRRSPNAVMRWARMARRRRKRSTSDAPVSTGRLSSADQPDHDATYSLGIGRPACSMATMSRHAEIPEPHEAITSTASSTPSREKCDRRSERSRSRRVSGDSTSIQGAFTAPGMWPARGSRVPGPKGARPSKRSRDRASRRTTPFEAERRRTRSAISSSVTSRSSGHGWAVNITDVGFVESPVSMRSG